MDELMDTYTQDYASNQNRQKLLQSMLAENRQPIQRANAGTSLGKILSAYFLNQGMNRTDRGMDEAVKGQESQSLADAMKISDAYTGTTPYPVRVEGNEQNRGAMLKAMMGSGNQGYRDTAIKSMAGLTKQNQPTANMRDDMYRQGLSAERQAVFDDSKLIRNDVGDAVNFHHPITGEILRTEKKNLAPKDQPANIASGEEAKLVKQLEWKPKIESAITDARALAAEKGEAFTDLSRAEAAMPGLLESVGELKELAMIATSTIGGRAWDAVVKETGFGATEGGTARAKFIAIVNNQVLPLLKPTFGAAFTVQEGESLKKTMGDPNATPEAKIAELNAFIEQKYRTIKSKQIQVSPEADEAVNWSDL